MSEETNEGKSLQDTEAKTEGRSRRRRRRSRARSKGDAASAENSSAPTSEQPQEGAAKKKSGGRRRRSRNRRRSGGGGGGGGGGKQGGRKSKAKSQNRSRNQQSGGGNGSKQRPRKSKTPESKFGGREPLVSNMENGSRGPLELTPFEVFCAYHLGIADDNRYRQQNVREVARRFDCSANELEGALKRFGMDREALKQAQYDISLAQLDMQVAPEGVDKRELAKVLYSEFLDMNPQIQGVIEAALATVPAPDESLVEE